MELSNNTKLKLFILLVILNVILRFPEEPHEIGRDMFQDHEYANSLSQFGYAKWWIHPASIIGTYPYSSPSAVPFLLSGISQSTGLNIELVVLTFSIILGIISIFAAYLMAKIIWNDDLFKFFVSFIFSTSQAIVTLSTWTANTRSLLIILLPLFIYLLLKLRTFNMRYCLLTFVILMLFLATHPLVYFVMPILMSFLVVSLVHKLKKINKFIKIHENTFNIVLLAGFLIMFLLPFFTRTFMEAEPRGYGGSRYAFLIETLLSSYGRYVGVLIVLTFGGYTYLLFKHNKRFEEWFLLLVLVVIAPLLHIATYMKWFIVFYTSLLIAISLRNIQNIQKHSAAQKKKYIASFIVILLLLNVGFTGYYQFLYNFDSPRGQPFKRHLEDRTYVGALWVKDKIGQDKNIVPETLISSRVAAISGVPTLATGNTGLIYDLIDPNELEIIQIYSPVSAQFYYSDPFHLINEPRQDWFANIIMKTSINKGESYAQRFVQRFNLSYFVENRDRSNVFTRSVHQTKDNIYDNGKIRIWDLSNK